MVGRGGITSAGTAVEATRAADYFYSRQGFAERVEAWFGREIAPKLDAFSLKEIAAATGLSLAACSRIRAGVRLPHPRHWDALRKLSYS